MDIRILPIPGEMTGTVENYIMKQYIAHIALVVEDYDEAIEFYTEKLHFNLIEDTRLSETKRWVMVAPKGSSECAILLAKAANEQQRFTVGNQTGGRVFLFLFTDNFERDYQNLLYHEIKIVREPVDEEWGRVVVFADLYGNLWDLIEPSHQNTVNKSATLSGAS
jgi:catechol 2,3-dioxygenase-like lactoylglutathione lyase family enzyme